MNRSTNIKSRVFRNLNALGLKNSDVQDEEIYDEMNNAQNFIISEVNPDKIIHLTLVTDVNNYLLTTDVVPQDRKNVMSIKTIQTPKGFGTIEVMTELKFNEFTAGNPERKGKPSIAMVVDNNLILYPMPDATANGKELQIIVYLSSAVGNIDEDTIPEIPTYFDKAIEYFATSQFLIGAEREQWYNQFTNELHRVRPFYNRSPHTLHRGKVEGW